MTPPTYQLTMLSFHVDINGAAIRALANFSAACSCPYPMHLKVQLPSYSIGNIAYHMLIVHFNANVKFPFSLAVNAVERLTGAARRLRRLKLKRCLSPEFPAGNPSTTALAPDSPAPCQSPPPHSELPIPARHRMWPSRMMLSTPVTDHKDTVMPILESGRPLLHAIAHRGDCCTVNAAARINKESEAGARVDA